MSNLSQRHEKFFWFSWDLSRPERGGDVPENHVWKKQYWVNDRLDDCVIQSLAASSWHLAPAMFLTFETFASARRTNFHGDWTLDQTN